uniref:C-type mannose receptor 2-like n=1 Tax=Saccoglossus kowalevskii TaxID=10224 RepID=A0ABM0MQ03_SACKO
IPEYSISTDETTWQDAKAGCESQCGKLAEICSQAEQDAVKDFLQEGDGRYWVGVSDVVGDNKHYEYTSGGSVIYTDWMENEPNNVGGTAEDCVEI